jgi:uncharacterized OB-fold protein
MTETAPAIEGWFTTGAKPALVGSACTTCGSTFFPPVTGSCRNPRCEGHDFAEAELSRRGRVWSYTDAQYQPPAPYLPATDPYEPFALAAVELPEGIVVLGQVAAGYGVGDLEVGREMELVVERAWTEEDGSERLMWKWKPVTELGEEGDQ